MENISLQKKKLETKIMNRKKRILFCNESSLVKSGFGKYGLEVLKRLHATGKYELAELATYGRAGDPRAEELPWTWFANMPAEGTPEWDRYHKHPAYQFGKFRFERTLLEFKPDIVVDIRDYWMQAFERESPFRRFFHWALMPTVDSEPQRDEWVEGFMDADGVLSYSDWGGEVLKKQSGGTINYCGTASPGADIDVYKPPRDKTSHKSQIGLLPNSKIIGTVMRNQKRKLYPDLMQSFRMFLDQCTESGREELANQTYLYLHTSYPDLGWDIPALLKEYGISNKTLFSYICRNCNHYMPSFFQGSIIDCHKCGAIRGATLPNVTFGLTAEQLRDVICSFDVYVQYAICEGFGMPQAEAAACGVPVMSVDWSAMSDVVRNVNGYPIEVDRVFRELETGADRVWPKNQHLVDTLVKFLEMPAPLRNRKGFEARQGAVKYYNWDVTAKKWEDYFDSVELVGEQGKWDSPSRAYPYQEPTSPPQIERSSEFVGWCIQHFLGPNADMCPTYVRLELMRGLDYGVPNDRGWRDFTREEVVSRIRQIADNCNQSENARFTELPKEDWVDFAYNRKAMQ